MANHMKAARKSLGDALEHVLDRCEELDEVEGSEADAILLAVLRIEMAAGAKAMSEAITERLLEWIARNRDRHSRIPIGDEKFLYASRDVSVTCNKQEETLLAVFDVMDAQREEFPESYGQPLVEILGGDLGALASLRSMIEKLGSAVVSKGGLKQAAVRKWLGDDFPKHYDETTASKLRNAGENPPKKLREGSRAFMALHRKGMA